MIARVPNSIILNLLYIRSLEHTNNQISWLYFHYPYFLVSLS